MEIDTKPRKPMHSLPVTSVKSAAQYRTSDKTSFAYVSARDRWPVILVRSLPLGAVHSLQMSAQTGAIDDVHRAILAVTEPTQRDEGKKIVEGIAKLKYEIQHDKQLTSVASIQIS